MTPDEQRIAIAEACGIRITPEGIYKNGRFFGRGYSEVTTMLPDYLHDLNAMFEAEEKILGQKRDYEGNLYRVAGAWAWHSTAAQRAEAFLKTLGLWKD